MSGKNKLAFNGSVDTGAANGEPGTLLLDPDVLQVINAGDADLVGTGNTSGQIAEWAETSDAAADPLTIDADAVVGALVTGNVELQANNTIDIDEAIVSGTASNDLTMRAGGDITIKQPITL